MLGSSKLGRQQPPALLDLRFTKHQKAPGIFGPFTRQDGLRIEYEVFRYEPEGALDVGPHTIWEAGRLRCTADGCELGVLHHDLPPHIWLRFKTLLHDPGHEFYIRRGALPWDHLHLCEHSTGAVHAGVIWHGLNFRAHFARILVTK